MPHSGVDPPDRRRWGAAGTSSQPQQVQKKKAPLMLLFLKNTRNPLGRSCPHTWSMTSEGRSLHLARPDPTQLDQHAARRTWHPAAPRRERMERARVAEDRSMQRAAKDPSSTTWPFTLARTTPRNKMTRSWPPSPHEGSTSTQLKLGTFGPAEGSIQIPRRLLPPLSVVPTFRPVRRVCPALASSPSSPYPA